MTGNRELAGSWNRQTSATAKWVSIDFPGLSLMQRLVGSIGTQPEKSAHGWNGDEWTSPKRRWELTLTLLGAYATLPK